MILLGIALVYTSVINLKNNLSPWPIPTQQSGSSLVDDGIYSCIRHPMYAGVLLGMIGLSLWTESFLRLLLTILLFLVLDAKSEYEETKLIDTYGLLYEDYMIKVPGKFYPLVNFTIN
jgi:protein-S-isoprenylcysteine O-methyltransferase Ste14